MKKLEMNNYESPLFRVYEIQVKKNLLSGSVPGGDGVEVEEGGEDY